MSEGITGQKNARQRGIEYAVIVALILNILPASVIIADILSSSRSGYATFHWSPLHVLAEKLLAVFPMATSHGYALTLGIEWMLFVGALTVVSSSRAQSTQVRRRFLMAGAVAFPISHFGLGVLLYGVVFVVAVCKFGFV